MQAKNLAMMPKQQWVGPLCSHIGFQVFWQAYLGKLIGVLNAILLIVTTGEWSLPLTLFNQHLCFLMPFLLLSLFLCSSRKPPVDNLGYIFTFSSKQVFRKCITKAKIATITITTQFMHIVLAKFRLILCLLCII